MEKPYTAAEAKSAFFTSFIGELWGISLRIPFLLGLRVGKCWLECETCADPEIEKNCRRCAP